MAPLSRRGGWASGGGRFREPLQVQRPASIAANTVARAYAELGQLTIEHRLQLKPEDLSLWTIQDYRDALDAIEGSEFEAIHLANLCRTPATKHILALVKP